MTSYCWLTSISISNWKKYILYKQQTTMDGWNLFYSNKLSTTAPIVTSTKRNTEVIYSPGSDQTWLGIKIHWRTGRVTKFCCFMFVNLNLVSFRVFAGEKLMFQTSSVNQIDSKIICGSFPPQFSVVSFVIILGELTRKISSNLNPSAITKILRSRGNLT